MDRRNAELRHVGVLVDFLCDEYPKNFKQGTYTHPLKGVCRTLILLKPLGEKAVEIDHTRINGISVDYLSTTISLFLNTPTEIQTITKFFVDETVM